MNKRRRALGWICTGLLLSAAVEACSASSSPDAPPGSGAVGGGAGTNTGDGTIVEPSPLGGAGGESTYNPLCGVPADGCLPDVLDACPDGLAGAGNASNGGSGGSGGRNDSAGKGGSGAGGKAGAGGRAGSSGGGTGGSASPSSGGGSGEGGESTPSAGGNGAEAGAPAGEGGATPTQPPESGNGGEGGATAGESSVGDAGARAGGDAGQSGGGGTGSGGGSVPWPYSCQVRVTSSRDVESVCKPSGSGKVGDGCFSGSDCGAGLGCVGDQSPGQCRPYCCAGGGACSERGTHCTDQRLVGEATRPRVPVCMPATGCDLAEPYPCTGPATCTCPENNACVVVSGDGTTSCVPKSSLPDEDEGLAGATCPCAWGHFCSEATNRCVKLCQTSAASGQAGAGGSGAAGCGRGRCQASPGLPTGWGVCIGSE